MPNPQTPTETPAPKIIPNPTVNDDGSLDDAQSQANASQGQDQDDTDNDADPGQVEIGDPVPENDRTVRAFDEGTDEDLPAEDADSVDPDPDPSTERH